ncbi:MAG: hypothetical protein FIB00_16500 [Chloroflexi bacterium]|nr:hypothetical protein [Chloroflexota bacterium]PWB43426.1 MAG: hypothetical protein C3F10_12150 [Dehalococcoidia bacterium]
MTSHRNHTVVVSLLAMLVSVMALAYPPGVEAQTPDGNRPRPDPGRPDSTNVSVTSGPNGVTVYIRVTEQSPGSVGGPSSNSSVSTASTRSCRLSVHNIGIVLSQSPWYQQERAAHPNHVFGSVFCDDGFSTFVWIPVGTPTDANVQVVFVDGDAVDPVTVALELLNHLPIPDIAIEANPSTGLVALPSWFWVDGYDGSAISSSDALSGVEVDVEIQPLSYRWSFGDGTTAETTSLGQRYPDESDIQHVYEQSSLAAGGAYTITVEVTFAAQYRINGGAWEALGPITRSFSNDYPVQQLQSVIVGQRP